MAVLRNWVKSAFECIVDPDKSAEVEELTELLRHGILTHKRSFVLADALKDRPYKERYLEAAKINLYQTFLDRAWQDGHVNANERLTLAWVIKSLALSEAKVQAINIERARPRFAEALAAAMDDGEISPAEMGTLTEIALSAGLSLKEFVTRFFRSEGEAFLRGLFAAAVADNRLAKGMLERIMATASRLGLSRAEVLAAVRPQAVRFIEHILADAKEDGVLSAEEDTTLREWLDKLDIPGDTRAYVLAELADLRLLTNIKNGLLLSLPPPAGLSIESGELVRYKGAAVWEATKLLKDGPKMVLHHGFLTITDSRLVFSSETRSDSISFSRIVATALSKGAIEVEVRAKPMQRFVCEGDQRIAAATLQSAVAMANRTLTNPDASKNSRNIPREVRQRVWTRDGGQCVECGAKDYLEFDHIIPVAKGGNSSEANVQLLCRRCNSKKSDRI